MRSAKQTGRIEAIREVINDLIARRADGETVTDDSIIQQHPDLMPELADELRSLDLVQRAERDARWIREGLRLRCPHCQTPIEVVDESSLADVICSSCGSIFSLTDDTDRTFRAHQHEMVNHFQLLDRVGIGAFGSVWSARDTQLDRIVAIKIPRKGQLSNEETELFIREARAAAQLRHPNIVSVLEVGRYKDRIYIACDYVQGMDLADWLTDQQATPREAAELCVTIADALQHAHNHGVIHRDLKPSNVMLDAAGEPHLMDFGLAKRESGEVTMTVDGKLLGTPAYMSPEQARGEAHDADRRSDVYSVGVILFELLTGVRPFRGSTRMLLHQVLMDEAPSPRKLNGHVPKDLETICLKCLEKAPNRRYQDAAALSDDLTRYLQDRPIQARRVSRFEKLRRWGRRNPVVASLSVALAAVLVFLAVAGTLSARRQIWLVAEQRLQLYRSDIDSAFTALSANDFESIRRLLERHIPISGEHDHRDFAWYHLDQVLLDLENQPAIQHDGRVYDMEFLEDGTLLTSGGDGVMQWDCVSREELRQLVPGPLNSVTSTISVSPDGKRLAKCCHPFSVKIWDLDDGNCIKTIAEDPFFAMKVRFSPDGRSLAVAGGIGLLGIYDLAIDEWQPFRTENKEEFTTVVFSPNGELLATTGTDRVLRVWDVKSRELVYKKQFQSLGVVNCLFSSDGRFLLHNGIRKSVSVIDLDEKSSDSRPLFDCTSSVRTLELSNDATLLAAACDDRTVRIWNLQSKRLVDTLVGHTSPITSVAFSKDGNTLASSSKKGNVRLWSISSAKNHNALDYEEVETSLAISERHNLLAVGWGATAMLTGRGELRFWDLDTLQPRDLPLESGTVEHVFSLEFSPTAPILVSGGGRRKENGQLKAWNIEQRSLNFDLPGYTHCVYSLSFSPDGRLLAAGGRFDERTVRLWDANSGSFVHEFAPLPKLNYGRLIPDIDSIAFSPDGETLAAGGSRFDGQRGVIRLWEVQSRKIINTFYVDGGELNTLEFFPDGHRLAISHAGNVSLYEVSTGKITPLIASGIEATTLAISPDGEMLAIGTENNGVRLWHLEAGGQLGELLVPHRVTDLAFTSDGQSLIAACENKSVRVWSTSVAHPARRSLVVLNAN